MGRPRKENSKSRSYRLRMTENDFNRLTRYSEKNGVSKADVINGALDFLYETLPDFLKRGGTNDHA